MLPYAYSKIALSVQKTERAIFVYYSEAETGHFSVAMLMSVCFILNI